MIGAFHNLKPGLIILLVVLCFRAQESYAQDSSPRSFARQQKARQQAEEKARREADAREIERIEAANRASAEKLDQTYQKIVEVLGKLELQNSANAAAEALGYMRKLTVVQTLPSGVLCQNETVKYRWSRSIDDILRDRLAPELLIDKKTCELFFQNATRARCTTVLSFGVSSNPMVSMNTSVHLAYRRKCGNSDSQIQMRDKQPWNNLVTKPSI